MRIPSSSRDERRSSTSRRQVGFKYRCRATHQSAPRAKLSPTKRFFVFLIKRRKRETNQRPTYHTMPVLHPVLRSPGRNQLVSQPPLSLCSRGVNFPAGTENFRRRTHLPNGRAAFSRARFPRRFSNSRENNFSLVENAKILI